MVKEYRKIPFTRVNTVSLLSPGKKQQREDEVRLHQGRKIASIERLGLFWCTVLYEGVAQSLSEIYSNWMQSLTGS